MSLAAYWVGYIKLPILFKTFHEVDTGHWQPLSYIYKTLVWRQGVSSSKEVGVHKKVIMLGQEHPSPPQTAPLILKFITQLTACQLALLGGPVYISKFFFAEAVVNMVLIGVSMHEEVQVY